MPAKRAILALVVGCLVAPWGGVRASAPELPNLVPLPAYDLRITGGAGAALRFSVATANRGDYALDLMFQGEPGSVDSAAALQCVAWTTDRVCEGRREAGSFAWHPEHAHHHFEDFALYELRTFRRDGVPDMRRRGLVATSGKVSYCLIDVERDREPSSPLYAQPHPLYYSCLVGAGFQGVSPGWRDVYGWGTPGQEFARADLRDGSFALVVRSDPAGRLAETDETDNYSVVGIEISGGVSEVVAFCASEPGSLTCQGPPPAE